VSTGGTSTFNVAVWILCRAIAVLDFAPPRGREQLCRSLQRIPPNL
jgi:hypothetical protein